MNLPTDTQMNDQEFQTLNRETDFGSEVVGSGRQSEIDALMRMVKRYPPSGSIYKINRNRGWR